MASLIAVSYCQVTLYPNGTQSATRISSGCASAIGGSISCDPYIQALAETNWYGSLNDSALQTSVCPSACSTSLSTYHSIVSTACANDPQPWDGIPATWAGDILWATYNRTCLKEQQTDYLCSCVPQACTTYLVQPGDTCWAIASVNSIRASKLISLNPTLNSDCTNLLSGTNICLSPTAGVYTPTTIAGATATRTGTYAISTVAAAGPTPYGTTVNCGGFYKVKPGDNCQQISLVQQITVALFEAINPSINSACTNLTPDLYYCVFPTADWITTRNATSTTTTSAYATPPALTPTGTTPDCYQWYVFRPHLPTGPLNWSSKNKKNTNTSPQNRHTVVSGDYCALIESTYGITFAQFQAWNPQINASCGDLLLGDA